MSAEPRPAPMFAGAKPPPVPESRAGEKPSDKVTALKQDGVPASRFGLVVGVAALGLLIVALWSVSPMAALIVGVAAVALVLVALLVHSAGKRQVSTTTKVNPDGTISTTTRRQRRQPRGDRSIRRPFGDRQGRAPSGGRNGSPGAGGRGPGRGGSQPGGGGPRGSRQSDVGRNGRPRTLAERATGRNRPTSEQRAARRADRAPAGPKAPAVPRQPAQGKAPAGPKPSRFRSRPNGPAGNGGKRRDRSPSGSKPNGSKPSGGGGGGRSVLHPFGGGGGGKRNNGGSGPKPSKPRIPKVTGDRNPYSDKSWWGPKGGKKPQKDPSKQSRREWWFGPHKPAEGERGAATPSATGTTTTRPSWRQRLKRKSKTDEYPAFDPAELDKRWTARFGKKDPASGGEAKPGWEGVVSKPPTSKRQPVDNRTASQMADEAALMSGANAGTVPAQPADHMAEEAALMSGEMWEPPKTRRMPSAPASKGGTEAMSETSGAAQNRSTPQSQAASWHNLGNASSRMNAAYVAVANQKRGEAQRAAGMKGMEAAAANATAEAGRASQDAAVYGGMAAKFRQFAAKVAGGGR